MLIFVKILKQISLEIAKHLLGFFYLARVCFILYHSVECRVLSTHQPIPTSRIDVRCGTVTKAPRGFDKKMLA
jgi:hypothetical protein